jgi:hypothetical protein
MAISGLWKITWAIVKPPIHVWIRLGEGKGGERFNGASDGLHRAADFWRAG